MNFNIKRGLLLLFFLFILTLQAQNTFLGVSQNIKSPQAFEFERYGNIPVSLNSGAIDLSVPLFSYGGQFDMSLVYNSSGFIPSKSSNYVGYNWFLRYGGVISRDIDGAPDDFFDSSTSAGGFLYTVKNKTLSNIDVYNGNFTKYNDDILIGNTHGELKPDRFNFNFSGISGYFYIGNNGLPIVSSNNNDLKISLDNVPLQHGEGCVPFDSEILITDGNGTKYYFGGGIDNLELNYDRGNGGNMAQLTLGGAKNYISSWYLRQIQYINGDKYIITNKKVDTAFLTFCNSINNLPSENSLIGNVKYFLDAHISPSYVHSVKTFDVSNPLYHSGGTIGNTTQYPSLSLTKKVFPDNIILTNASGEEKFSINFSYLTRNNVVTWNYDSYVLDQIIIKNRNKNIKTYNFDYDYIKDYSFLKSISSSSGETYSLAYYTGNLPDPNTRQIDYWGFWNGYSNTNLIPEYKLDRNTGELTIIGDERKPNASLANISLLKKITYPTGGYSEFEYEANSYSKKIASNISNNFFKSLVNENDYAGGARISKITNFDGLLPTITEYKYIKNFGAPNTGLSSGILNTDYRMVDYMYSASKLGNTTTQVKEIRESSYSFNKSTSGNGIVNYSEVTELKNGDIYKKYIYSDYATNPDILSYRTEKAPELSDNVSPLTYLKNNFVDYVDKQKERGLALSIIDYKNGLPVRTTTNSYTALSSHNLLSNNYVTKLKGSVSWFYFSKIYCSPYLLSQTTVSDILNGNDIKTTTEYIYNSSKHLNLTDKTIKYPDNSQIKINYLYVGDLRHGNQPQQNIPPYQSLPYMDSYNMIGTPLITSVYKNNIFQRRQQTTYDYNPTILKVLPKREIFFFEDQTISTPNNGFGSVIVPNPNYGITDVTYDQYNSNGNLILYTPKSGSPVALAWGYNKSLPIVKIEGKDAGLFLTMFDTDLTSLSNSSNNDIDPNSKELFKNKLDAFQKRQFNLDVQITTYTHNPLIGVTSTTPPSGIRENYIYDTANRLEKVVDINGRILKENKYNYKQ